MATALASEATPAAPPALPGAVPPTALVAFNLDPAAYVHPSWLPAGRTSLRSASASLTDDRSALSAWLAAEHRLDRDFDWELAEPIQRVFATDRAWLDALALEIGLALSRDDLARAIDGPTLRRLHALPGLQADGVRFALTHSPTGMPLRAAARLAALERSPTRTAPRLRRSGAALLLSLVDPHATGTLLRARLRFARGLRAWRFEDATHRAAWANYVLGRLLPERFTPWRWLH